MSKKINGEYLEEKTEPEKEMIFGDGETLTEKKKKKKKYQETELTEEEK